MTKGFTQEIVSSRVEKIISEQIGSDTILAPETNLQDDLGMDSLELVELGITLENEFDVLLPDAEIRRCATLDDIVQFVCRAEPEAKSA
jgi:acyl carrier protein